MKVIKRDGLKENFNLFKIEKAINKANNSLPKNDQIDEERIQKVLEYVEKKILKLNESVSVEDIQNMVEEGLMNKNLYELEKAFHDYRVERSKKRFERLEIIKSINEKLNASNVQNQNANVDEYSFGGRKGEADAALMKQMALEYHISPKHAKAHENNERYIHDLDAYVVGSHNCLSLPLDHLLLEGFNTRQTDVRPANSVNTAFQLTAVLFQLQSLQQFGGVSATHIDWTMVPFVRKSFMKHYIVSYIKKTEDFMKIDLPALMFEDYDEEIIDDNGKVYSITRNKLDDWIDDHKKEFFEKTKLSDKDFTFDNKDNLDAELYQSAIYDTILELKQATEGMYHNLNTLQSRSGNQLPFTSINYGTCTLEEGRIVTRALIGSSIKGVGKLNKTSIFPCGIFQYQKGVTDVGSKNYDLFKIAVKSTTRRLYPNYANVDWSGNDDSKSYKLKEEYLSNLSQDKYEKLVNILKNNPKLQDVLGLELEEKKIVPKKNAPNAIFSTMGCRTANGFDINWFDSWTKAAYTIIETGKDVPYKFLGTGQQKDGRGNVCPSTIILPTLAMKAKKRSEKNGHPEYVVDEFMAILEEAISDTKDELIERYNWICAQNPASAKFMYENNTMFGYIPEEGIRSALKHGTLAIGQIGLAETLQILIGCDQTTEKGMNLAKQIEQLFKDKCAEYKKEHHYIEPSNEKIKQEMIKKFEKKYGRELSKEELQQINDFVNKK